MSGDATRNLPHVLVFGLRWPPETFIRAKLERLAGAGMQITVACADSSPRGPAIPGIHVERVIPTGRTSALALVAAVAALARTRPRDLRRVARAARAPTAAGRRVGRLEALGRLRTYARLARLRPDVVHFEWNTAAVHYHSLASGLGCPSIVSVRGADLEVHPHNPATDRLTSGYGAAFSKAAVVHCVSKAAQGEAAAYGVPATKVCLIRPAVDTSLFRPRTDPRRSNGSFRIVGIGWLHWRKGWEYALQAVAALIAEGVPATFDLVGPEPTPEMATTGDLRRILRTVDDLGLQDRVTVRGELEPGRVCTLLQEADVLLHTSLAEGIPNVVLEAMACGVPVVATDVGGTREVVADGVEGYLVAPRDYHAATRKLAALWVDLERRRTMGAAGRARVERELELDRQIEQWLELYTGTVADRARLGGLRIAEIGLDLPLEPYLRRKLEGLADRGAEITVASIVRAGAPLPPVPGASLEPLPHWREPPHLALVGLAKDLVSLLLTDLPSLRRLVGAWLTSPPGDRRWRAARLHARLARLRADVAHFEWASFAAACAPLFRTWNFPVVVSCHGSEVLVDGRDASRVDLAALFARVDAVHCVSEAVERAAAEHGLDGASVRIIPSAVDPTVFRPSGHVRSREGELVVVTVGALRWVKGYEHALSAVSLLVAAGVPVRYEIAGDEPAFERGELERITATIDDLGLARRVRLHGRLQEPSVVSLLQSADVYLQASLSEGMPTAVLEAMACGLPVVATDVGGTREAVTHGVEGYLVPPRVARATADALAVLWKDPELRRSMGAAARARVESRLTLEQQLDGFESLYRELARS